MYVPISKNKSCPDNFEKHAEQDESFWLSFLCKYKLEKGVLKLRIQFVTHHCSKTFLKMKIKHLIFMCPIFIFLIAEIDAMCKDKAKICETIHPMHCSKYFHHLCSCTCLTHFEQDHSAKLIVPKKFAFHQLLMNPHPRRRTCKNQSINHLSIL